MTSSNGNIFRVTGPLCGEFTGPGEFLAQRPVMRSFDVFFDLRLNKRLSKQPWCWWFETPAWSLWRQRNVFFDNLFEVILIQWPMRDMEVILQVCFSNSFYGLISRTLPVKLVSGEGHRTPLRISHHWFMYCGHQPQSELMLTQNRH